MQFPLSTPDRMRGAIVALAVGIASVSANADEIRVNSYADAGLPVGATTCNVEPVDAEPVCTLRAALERANAISAEPTTIVLAPGEYVLSEAGLGSLVFLHGRIEIVGDTDDPNEVIITASAQFDRPLVRSLTGMGGLGDPMPRLRNLTLRGAHSTDIGRGGALDCNDARISVERVRFVQNVGVAAGAFRAEACRAAIRNSEFAQNSAPNGLDAWAGAMDVSAQSTLSIESTSFVDNQASVVSALRVRNSGLTLQSVAFHGNSISSFSGATVHLTETLPGTLFNAVSIVGNLASTNSGATPGLATHTTLTSHLTLANSLIAGNQLNNNNWDVKLGPGVVSEGHNRIGRHSLVDPSLFSEPTSARGVTDTGVEAQRSALTPWGFPQGQIPIAGGPLEDLGSGWNAAFACPMADAGGRARAGLGGECDIGAVERFTRPASWSFVVDTNADVTDARPGDGRCEGGAQMQCSVRAAVDEVNALFEAGHWGPYDIQVPAELGPYHLTMQDPSNLSLLLLRAEDVTLRGVGGGGAKATLVADIHSDALLSTQYDPYRHGYSVASRLTIDGNAHANTAIACKNVLKAFYDDVNIRGADVAVYFDGCNVEVEDSRIFENGSDTSFAAVGFTRSHVVFRRTSIDHNFAMHGIYAVKAFTLITPDFDASRGSSLTMLASTLSSNTVGTSLLHLEDMPAYLWNSTITANVGSQPIMALENVRMNSSHSVFAGNENDGIQAMGSTTVNSLGANVFGTQPVAGEPWFEHVLGVPDAFGVEAGGLGLDPFEANAAWAGHMPSGSLVGGNAVLNRGAPNVATEAQGIGSGLCLRYDQRNLPRDETASASCDIGALEFFPGPDPDPEPEPGEAIFADGFD